MSADTLREAASKMRERAEAATPGPWTAYGDHLVWPSEAGPAANDPILAMVGEAHDDCAAHIASWHPAVALAVAGWLDDIAERHARDPEPVELVLHVDEDCPTGECVDPGYHEECIVCTGCYPSWEGVVGHSLWPCVEFNAALAVASVYLGDHDDETPRHGSAAGMET